MKLTKNEESILEIENFIIDMKKILSLFKFEYKYYLKLSSSKFSKLIYALIPSGAL